MSDQMGQRQLMNCYPLPPSPPPDLSADQRAYVDQLARGQAAATTDPTLNGADAERRYQEGTP
jgi:hypothetical protein